MGKKHNIDFISDLHERADHNINSHYWFNRVTPLTIAQWRTNKVLMPLFFLIYSAFGLQWLNSLNQTALEENKTFWALLLDFHDSFTSARFVGILLFSAYWLILGIGTFQTIVHKIGIPSDADPIIRKKEQKKKHPRCPKNYK